MRFGSVKLNNLKSLCSKNRAYSKFEFKILGVCYRNYIICFAKFLAVDVSYLIVVFLNFSDYYVLLIFFNYV